MIGKNYLTTVATLTIATGMQLVTVPVYATEQGQQRQEARDTKQDGRKDAGDDKAACKAGDDNNRAECRQDKRDTKQDSRDTARDIKKQ